MKIGIVPPEAYPGYEGLFSALSSTFGVSFEPACHINEPQWDAVVVLDGLLDQVPPSRPVFGIAQGESIPVQDRLWLFGASEQVPVSLRGAHLIDTGVSSVARVAADRSWEVLAHCDGHPVWLRSLERPATFISALPLPRLSPPEMLHQHFHPGRWAALLPLLAWLKQLTSAGWQFPPLRASIVIDDPNLHAESFGYLNYRALLADATAHNYHASVATVPLDSWYAADRVAGIFRDHPERLSLAVHGNNHTKAELALGEDELARYGLACQALRRVASLERRAGVRVSRVMVPPHEACNEATAAAMYAAGFDGACVAIPGLLRWNPEKNWMPSLGIWMAYPLGGLPVFHRTYFEQIELRVRLMAFLGQPIVFVSHHADFKHGFDKFRAVAQAVNSISPAQWLSLGDIARSNYAVRHVGERLEVQLFARRVSIPQVPATTSVAVTVPWLGTWEMSVSKTGLSEAAGAPISVLLTESGDMSIELIPNSSTTARGKAPLPYWPFLRRLLCESRDRILPLCASR